MIHTDESEGLSDLEKEFEKTFNLVHVQIQENLKQASKLIDEAVALAEQNGIPFRPKFELCSFKMSYLPTSISEKFPDIDKDFVESLTDATGYWEYGGGWQTSQTC